MRSCSTSMGRLDWIIGCHYKGFPDYITSVRNPIGCNMSFKKEVFNRIGCFNTNLGRIGEKLIGSEEVEYSLRIIKNNPSSKILYNPYAVVYHNVPKKRTTIKYLINRSFFEGYSKALISDITLKQSKNIYAEYTYIKNIFKKAIPLRIKNIYKLKSIYELLTLFLSMSLVFIGYLYGKFFARARK